MNNKILPVKSEIESASFAIELFKTVTRAGINNEFLHHISVSCLSEGKETILYFNPKALYCYFIDCEINEAFFYFITSFLNFNKITYYDAYKIINVFEKITKEEQLFFKLFNIFGWASGKKGFAVYKEFGDFSPILVHFIKEKKCSLSDAYFFHMYFFSNYESILSCLPTDLSCSEINFVLKSLSEFGKSKNIGTAAITDILQGKVFKEKKDFIDFVYSLRFPLHSKSLKKFQAFIKEFNFPKGVKINFDKTFEKKESRMEIDFDSLKNLGKKIYKITKEIDSKLSLKDFKDLFIEDNLFNKDDE